MTPMLAGRRKKIKAQIEQYEREKELRDRGLAPAETNDERTERRKTEYTSWLITAHQKAKRGEDFDDWTPDDSRKIGEKRKNTGKTFAVPELEDDDFSDTDEPSPERSQLPSMRSFVPRSPFETSPNLTAPQPTHPPQHTQSIMASPPRVGRTFAAPDYSISDVNSTSFNIRDSDMMSLTSDYKPKPVAEWTGQDYKEYLKSAYGFEPEQLAREVESMRDGEIPDTFMKAHQAIVDMRERARDEIYREIQQYRDVELAGIRQAVEEERMALENDYNEYRQQRALVRAQYNGLTLAEDAQLPGTSGNNKWGYPFSSPDNSTVLENVFAVAASNAAGNLTATKFTETEQNAPPTPNLAHAQLPSANGTAKNTNVSWAENVIHNHAAPGPNEPVKSSTPLPKSALKGRQLESLERKMSEATRYTPKQPSRLREVSDVTKTAGSDKFPPVMATDGMNYMMPMTADPYPELRKQLNSYFTEMPISTDFWTSGDSFVDVYNPYAEVRAQVLTTFS
jgi:hypothetical protein